MRAKEKENLLKVGIFMTLMLGVVLAFILSISSENKWFSSKVVIKAHLNSAENLKLGGVVQLNGLKIGKVSNIEIIKIDQVELSLVINEEYLRWIKKDSLVEITSKGLVGDKIIQIITDNDQSSSFKPEKHVLHAKKTKSMNEIVDQGSHIADKVDQVLIKLDQFLSQANANNNLQKTLSHASSSSEKLNHLLSKVEKRKTIEKLEKILDKGDRVMSKIIDGPGSMHSLIYNDELYNQLTLLVGGARRNEILNYFIRQSLKSNNKKEK